MLLLLNLPSRAIELMKSIWSRIQRQIDIFHHFLTLCIPTTLVFSTHLIAHVVLPPLAFAQYTMEIIEKYPHISDASDSIVQLGKND